MKEIASVPLSHGLVIHRQEVPTPDVDTMLDDLERAPAW